MGRLFSVSVYQTGPQKDPMSTKVNPGEDVGERRTSCFGWQ